MSAYVNLMTERAKFMATGARIGNLWAAVVLGLLALLVPQSGWTWHRREAIVRRREALDASYEPIRQMSASNRAISSQAAELVNHQQMPLTLARRQSFVTLVNVVSEAVAATEGAANLDRLHYGQGPAAPDGGAPPYIVTLDVTCDIAFDMTELTSALERPPFARVKIQSSMPAGETAERKQYVLQCEL